MKRYTNIFSQFPVTPLSYEFYKFPSYLYRLNPMSLALITKTNESIYKDVVMLNIMLKNRQLHYLMNIQPFLIVDPNVPRPTIVYTKKKLTFQEIYDSLSVLERSLYEIDYKFSSSKALAVYEEKPRDLVVYKGFNVFTTIKHYFGDFVFYIKDKYRFNKLHLKYADAPKFLLDVPAHTIKTKGYTLKTKQTVFNNGSIQNKSRFIYHKYDFDKEILNLSIETERLRIEFINISYEILHSNGVKFVDPIRHICPLQLVVKDDSKMALSSIKPLVNVSEFVKLKDLPFLRFKSILFDTFKGIDSILKVLLSVKEQICSINVHKGFVEHTDVFNKDFYPFISDIIALFIDKESFSKLNNYEKCSIYRWSINILLINMYKICHKILSRLSLVDLKLAKLDDINELKVLVSRINVLSNWCYSMLDNSIKQHLIKRNLNIYSDIITGFDTEYVAYEVGFNKLLSAQLSSSHILKLSIPIYKGFDFEGVNTLTSETYLKSVPKFCNPSLVIKFISEQIKESRIYKFKSHDSIMSKIASFFSEKVQNLSVTNRGIEVAFDKACIKNLFVVSSEEEDLKLNFSSLIRLITSRFSLTRENLENSLIQKIIDIDFSSSYCENFTPRVQESWNADTLVESPCETLILSNSDNEKLSLQKEQSSSFVKQFPVEEILQISPLEKFGEADASLEASASLEEGELGGRDFFWNPVTSVIHPLKDTLQINVKRRIYLAAHYNSADLSLLNDWKNVSSYNIDIVKKCFTSLSIPFKYNGKEKVYLRDTMLLASATAKSLKALAYAYKLEKVEISDFYKTRMDFLLKEKPEEFKEYAMKDSLITLIHTLFINDFSFRLGSMSIPNTLGTLSSKNIKNKWREDKYRGYQIDVKYPIGDVRPSHTPKGIQFGSSTLEMCNLFIGSYRGGRNECFRYGIDRSTKWFDYDLSSCYSTIMGMMGQPEYEKTEEQRIAALAENVMGLMGQPDYSKGMWIQPKEDLSKLNLQESYSAFKIKFCLPAEVKYPPFPVTLDESITIYPSSGITLVTGMELYAGLRILNQTLDRFKLSKKDYFIEILYGSYIPFKKIYDKELKTEALAYSPFYEVIKELQENRRMWKKKSGKGSAMERIYKDLGNMLYGKIVCGISNKKVFDGRTNQMKTMIGNDLSNPILGTWITGYVRAVIAELLHNVDLLGGQVVSCTTDGFVCDIENLESKIVESFDMKDTLLKRYREIRTELSGDASALEVKTSVNGIIQWTTRGQLSLESIPDEWNKLVPISAATGYQKTRDHQENLNIVKYSMSNGNKILFLQKQLTGALDTYKTGSHVSMKSSQRTFRTIFDCKRFVISSSEEMKKTKPFAEVSEALLHRTYMNSLKQSVFSEKYSVFTIAPSKTSVEEVVKYFVRMISILHDYKISSSLKLSIASLLMSLDKNISEKYVLDLMSFYENDKGNIVTKLPIYTKSEMFVKTLYDEIAVLAEKSSIFKDIQKEFLIYFDNFYCLKEAMILQSENLKQEMKNLLDCKEFIVYKKDGKTIIEIPE